MGIIFTNNINKMTTLEVFLNILGFLALSYYVGLRLYKIHMDFTEDKPKLSYYIPTAVSCILFLAYGIGLNYYPIIATAVVEFIASFILILYKYNKRKTNMGFY